MSLSNDVCVMCNKAIKNCHKIIFCKHCKQYVHKKCTNLKQRELKKLNPGDWECTNCCIDDNEKNATENYIRDLNDLNKNLNIVDVDFSKYDNMAFNPLRYESMTKESDLDNDNQINVECTYVTNDQLSKMLTDHGDVFSLLNVNTRSLNKNFEKLISCLKSLNHKFTVIGLSETHLRDKPHEYYDLPGYSLEYVNRVGRKWGGVCMYISNDVKYKIRQDLCEANSNFESCFIEIENINERNSLIGVVYRAHTAIDHFITDVEPLLQTINAEKKECYILGDFNIDLLKDDIERPIHDYLDLIYSHCMIPTVLKPTRITETSATLIDNILTNSDNEVTTAILVTDISDHLPSILLNKSKTTKVTQNSENKNKFVFKRKYTDDNISHFKQKLSQVDWNGILQGIDADCDYNKFIDKFNELYDECIPLRKCSVSRRKVPQSPWITKGLLKSINNKNKLYKEYLQCPNESRNVKFKTYRNKLNNLIRKSKREYFYRKFKSTQNNIKDTWKNINNMIGRKKNNTQQSSFKMNETEKINEPKTISNAFNDFFVNIGPKLAANIQHSGKNYFDYLKQQANTCMYLKPIVAEEIVKIVGKFNPNKSPGHDDIGNMIVKKVAIEISEPLAIIFNCSLITGVVPKQLKTAKVIPIYKKR